MMAKLTETGYLTDNNGCLLTFALSCILMIVNKVDV
jgi:hypothetical protein